MDYSYLKALHIIFIVTWFSGLFYIVRLFIYQTEAKDQPEPAKSILINQFKIMEKRLWYIITWPSAIITLVLGPSMLQFFSLSDSPWLKVKIFLVFLLYIYQFYCHFLFKKLQQDKYILTSMRLRLFNEIATILLFAIVFLVVFKNLISLKYGIISVLVLAFVLMFFVKLYKKLRSK